MCSFGAVTPVLQELQVVQYGYLSKTLNVPTAPTLAFQQHIMKF